MRGRKPKPTALKKLAGNPGKRKLNAQEPKFADAPAASDPPADMPKDGKWWWRKHYQHLQATVLQETDLCRFEMSARCYAIWRQRVRDGCNASRELADFLKVSAGFGLTPADRSHLKIEPPAPKDEFAEFAGTPAVVGRIG